MKARDLIIFVAGGASLYLKDVYRRYAQEEIDSIIEREENRCERCDRYDDTCEDVEEPTNEAIEQAQEAAKSNANKSSITEYANVIEKEGCCTNAPTLELLERRLSLFRAEADTTK